jgi:hypothetical protein
VTTTPGDLYRLQALGCRGGGSQSPFYAGLLDALAENADAGGPAARVIAPIVELGFEAALPLRLLGGVHRAVLSGAAPNLEARFPSVGGDGDVEATVPELLGLLDRPPPGVLDALRWDPQTNEVGRAAALVVGLGVIARDTELPLRLFEIGSSGGLNLRLDGFWFDAHGARWGEPESLVRFGELDYDHAPPLSSHLSIAARRGCDLNPIDASTDHGGLTLLSYVWPDQGDRLARLRAALAVARSLPVAVDRASADVWVEAHLEARAGTATVLVHSIMWQYLPIDVQTRITDVVTTRARRADRDSPIAWLRFEPSADWTHPETWVRIWPHAPEERLVATSTYHGPPVRVLDAGTRG